MIMVALVSINIAVWLCVGLLFHIAQRFWRLVNDRHGPILEASVHDVVLACLGLKVHPNGTGYGYKSETP